MSAADDLLEHLDPEQRDVATTLRGPVCVVAGAGTGKTRAITHRIAYGVATGVYQPQEVLAVTFTTRAAGEMRGRLGALGAPGVQARTFHSAALRQARYFWPQVYGTVFPEVVQSKFGLVAEAVRRLGLRADTPLLRDLSAEIEWAKVSSIRPADYVTAAAKARREVADLDAATVGSLMTAYEDVKRERGRIDMEDILLVTAAILADEERVAAQVRRQYRWFVVDEFQDVNPLQSTLLDLWLGGRDDICVVGDPRQTIYSFAGASPKILASFTRRHPGAERIELVRNYRSTPQVVAAANAVFDQGRAESDGVRLQSQAEPGDPVTYLGHPDETAEASSVANEIALLHRRGMPYREMAVLFRINAQSEAYEEALGEHGIPFTLRGVEGFFHRAEVRQAITLLRGAARGGQDDGGGLVDEVRAVLASMGHTDAAPSGTGAVRDRWESLHAIVSMATDLAEELGEAADLTALVADLDRRAENAHAPTADGVTLATLHSAKGLEWDAVFCVGVHEGMVPSVHADTPQADRRGAPAVLRRHHPGPVHAGHLVGVGAQTRWSWQPSSQPIPRLAAAGRPRGPEDGPVAARPQGRPVPHLQAPAGAGCGAQARTLRRLPGHVRRRALRQVARLAHGAGRRGQGARLRRLHRCHLAGDRRDEALRSRRSRHRSGGRAGQAGALRRPGARARQRLRFTPPRTPACSPRESCGSARWRRAGSARRRRLPTPGASARTRAGC